MAPYDKSCTSFCWYSIVALALPCIVACIVFEINRNIGRKLKFVIPHFHLPRRQRCEPRILLHILPSQHFRKKYVHLRVLLCYHWTGVDAKEETTVYDFSSIIFTLHLRRKPLYYIMHIIVPCCLLFFVVVATFVLQPGCAERLGLGKFFAILG